MGFSASTNVYSTSTAFHYFEHCATSSYIHDSSSGHLCLSEHEAHTTIIKHESHSM